MQTAYAKQCHEIATTHGVLLLNWYGIASDVEFSTLACSEKRT